MRKPHPSTAAGLVIRDLPASASNWRSSATLDAYLRERGVVGIAGIDTRRLTRILREKGAQNGCLMAGDGIDADAALAMARHFPGLKGMDLAKEVSTAGAYEWTPGRMVPRSGPARGAAVTSCPYHVVAYDYGVKRNILRMLAERGCRVTVVPGQDPGRCRCWRCNPTAFSCPTARAIRNPAITRSRPSASC